MWDFSQTIVTFDNVLYFWDGSGPSSGTGVLFGTTGQSGGRVVLRSKKVGEVLGYPVDFISSLAPGEVILSAAVTATVYAGTDPNPGSIILGAPTFQGTIVNQGIQNGVIGVIYEVLYRITTTFGQTVEISGYLAVVPDL